MFQSLKDYGSGILELQLKLTTAARNRQKAGGDSLYNIRRVDWEGIREKLDTQAHDSEGHISSFWDRSEDAWNERTVYVVCHLLSHILVVIILFGIAITTLLTEHLLGKHPTKALDITSRTFIHPLLRTASHHHFRCR